MKYIFLTLSLACVALSAHADRIPVTQAQQLAANFAQTHVRRVAGNNQSLNLALSSDGYYAFNRGTDAGFVIVASDDAIDNPILGFADEGSLQNDLLPDAFRMWLRALDASVINAQRQPAPVQVSASREDIAPLTPTWDQDNPYNILVPLSGGSRSHTGCVATAMVQVMYTHKWPTTGKGSVSSNGETIDLSQETYNWDLMPDKLDSNSPQEQINEVARLMRDGGYALRSNYSWTNATTATMSNIPNVLSTYFYYANSTADLQHNDYTKEGWDEIIYNELANGRPVTLAGYNNTSNIGHCFVTDGYRNGFFHINWGWGGKSNAYLRFDALEPTAQGAGGSDGGYSMNVEAIVGIQPARDGVDVDYPNILYSNSAFTAKQSSVSRSDASLMDFTGNFSQPTKASSLSFILGIEVVDAEGQSTIIPMSEATSFSGNSGGGGGWGGNSGSNVTISVSPSQFPQADGDYRIYGAFQGNDGQWRRLYHSTNTIMVVRAHVEGDVITLTNPSGTAYDFATQKFRLSNITPSTGESFTITLDATCTEGGYYGDLSIGMYQGGSKKATTSSQLLAFDENETRTISFSATAPTTEGLTEVYLQDSKGNKFGTPAYIVVGGKENPADIRLTEAISILDQENVDKNNMEIHASLTCLSGNYAGKVQASVWGGTRYKTEMGRLVSESIVIPEGKSVDIVITGAIETLEAGKKYKVYLHDANGGYFTGQEELDNLIFTAGEGTDGVTTIQAEDNSVLYDLQGRRLSTRPQRGIYINNGAKIMVK